MPNQDKSITKSTLYTLLSQIPAHFFGILAGIFIARTLGTSGRGEYAIFLATMTLFCTVFGGSITTTIIYFISSNKMEQAKINALAVVMLLLTMILSIIAVSLSFIPSIKQWIIPEFPWNWEYAKLMLQIIFLTQLNATLTAYFQGHQFFKRVNKILILNSIYSLLGFGYIYWIGLKDSNIYLRAILDMYQLILLMNTLHWLFYLYKSKGYHFNFRLSLKEIKPFMSFTSYNHISEIAKFISSKAILWIAAFFLTTSDLGIFSIGLGVTSLMMLVSIPVTQVLETYINGATIEARKEIFTRFSRIQFTFLFIAMSGAALIIPYLIPFAYGKAFETETIILCILLFGLLFGCQSNLLTSYFIAAGKLNINLWSSYISLTTLLLCGFVLIPQYGLLGAALTQTVSYIAQYFFQIFILRIREDIPYSVHWIITSDIDFIKKQFKLANRKG